MLRIPEKNVRFLLDFGKSAAYNSKLENNCSRLASESVKKMLNPSNFLLVLNSTQQTCFKIKKNQNRIEYELRFLLFLKIVLNTRAAFSKVHKSYSVRNAFSVFFCNRSEYERCLFKFSRIVLSTKAVFYVFQNRSEYEMLFQKSKSYWKRILPPKAWISLLAEAHAERLRLQNLVA